MYFNDHSGASIEDVRAHLDGLLPKSSSNLEAEFRSETTWITDEARNTLVNSTPRRFCCLFVDEICLESLEFPFPRERPAVKLVVRDWENGWSPEERLQEISSPWHDGITDCMEEDVGWMYMSVNRYVEFYANLLTSDWDDVYLRPPWMDCVHYEATEIGHWRRKVDVKEKSNPET